MSRANHVTSTHYVISIYCITVWLVHIVVHVACVFSSINIDFTSILHDFAHFVCYYFAGILHVHFETSENLSARYCIWRVKDSSMADELRRTTMESRASRLTRSLRASLAERKTLTGEDQLPRVLDQSNAKVGPDGSLVK